MISWRDGAPLHSYGRGAVSGPYAPSGHIDNEIMGYSAVLPDRPLYDKLLRL
jgi:hypothetical protein